MKHVPIGGTTDQKIRGRGTTRTDVRIDDSTDARNGPHSELIPSGATWHLFNAEPTDGLGGPSDIPESERANVVTVTPSTMQVTR
jgi:hypothetical protein